MFLYASRGIAVGVAGALAWSPHRHRQILEMSVQFYAFLKRSVEHHGRNSSCHLHKEGIVWLL
jgi:hypothetical protein